jgi:hypothetical protein
MAALVFATAVAPAARAAPPRRGARATAGQAKPAAPRRLRLKQAWPGEALARFPGKRLWSSVLIATALAATAGARPAGAVDSLLLPLPPPSSFAGELPPEPMQAPLGVPEQAEPEVSALDAETELLPPGDIGSSELDGNPFQWPEDENATPFENDPGMTGQDGLPEPDPEVQSVPELLPAPEELAALEPTEESLPRLPLPADPASQPSLPAPAPAPVIRGEYRSPARTEASLLPAIPPVASPEAVSEDALGQSPAVLPPVTDPSAGSAESEFAALPPRDLPELFPSPTPADRQVEVPGESRADPAPEAITPGPADSSDQPGWSELAAPHGAEDNTLVHRTVGSAEGTRAPDGSKTPAYEGHPDPGNGVWNIGSFSYQHGAPDPRAADAAQMVRLQDFYATAVRKATERGLPLTKEEALNAIDVANQCPLCVTEDGGYIERLAEAKSRGMTGDEAILWARTWSYWDLAKNDWNAPGLVKNPDEPAEDQIRRDQNRRMTEINSAIAHLQAEGLYRQEIASAPGTDSPLQPAPAARPSLVPVPELYGQNPDSGLPSLPPTL